MGMIVMMMFGIMMLMAMLVFVLMRGLLFAPEFLAGEFFLPGNDHVNLGRADAAAVDAGDLQTRVHAQGLHCAREQLGRNSGVDQGAEKHVAADPGKTF